MTSSSEPTKSIAFRKLLEFEHDVFIDEQNSTRIEIEFSDESCIICCGRLVVYHEPQSWNQHDIDECDEILARLPDQKFVLRKRHLYVCQMCGWWRSNERMIFYPFTGVNPRSPYDYCPAIEEIDIRDSKVATDDLIFHLTRKWEDRKLISASAAESLVADLLKEHLQCDIFSATANTNMADRGIDLHVCHRNGDVLAAVQVKRRMNKEVEGVAEVRNFIGALAVENISKGIFVTTATRYTREAKRAASKLAGGTRSRLELDLIDGGELFEILKTLPRDDKLILPNNIEGTDIWLDATGGKHTTRMLLYGY